MSANPITAGNNALVVEIIRILKNHRIDEIVIIDDESRPVGIVDVQDLARLKLV